MQITATWGWEDARPFVQKMIAKKLAAKATELKQPVKKVWSIRGFSAPQTTQAVAKPGSPTPKHQSTAKEPPLPPIPPGQYPEIWLTIADHFQWDG